MSKWTHRLGLTLLFPTTLLAVACGNDTQTTTEGGGSTSDGSTSSATQTTNNPTTSPGTATATDGTTESPTTGNTTGDATTGGTTGGAVTFLCDGCLCDAGTTYCRKVLAGLIEPQGDPPLCPVVPEDPLLSGCVAYPDARGDTPTCDCIPNLNNNCFCQEQMGTFTLTCPLP